MGDDRQHELDNPDRAFSVLIADDKEFTRTWMKDELTKNFPNLKSAVEAATVAEAVAKAGSLRPDVVLMDIQFKDDPAQNGIDAAAQIWKGNAEARILVVSDYNDEVYVQELNKIAPENSVYGYVMKDKVSRHASEAVRALLSGDCWLDRDVQRVITRLMRKDYSLPEGEFEALVCIALGLSDQTAGRLLCLTPKAIQARLVNLYSRFAIPPKGHPDAGVFNPRSRAVWIGMQRGLINEHELKAFALELAKRAKELDLPSRNLLN